MFPEAPEPSVRPVSPTTVSGGTAGQLPPQKRPSAWLARRGWSRRADDLIAPGNEGENEDGEACLPGLADLLAPSSAELAPDWVRLDNELACVLPVVGYPRYVSPGWFGQLIDLDLPGFEVSLHLQPRGSVAMIRTLRRKLTEFDASHRLAARRGHMQDPERELAMQDVSSMIDRLQRGEERIFDVSLYLLARASDGNLRTLEQRVQQITSALATLFLEGGPATFEQDLAVRSCLPMARDELQRGRQLDSGTIATAFPFLSMSLTMREGILYGVVPQNNTLIILDPFSPELENANMTVFAMSGAGKSFTCKLLALRSLITGTAVTVIDPEPLEEYRPLCEAVHGEYVRLAPGAAQHINPFDLVPPAGPELPFPSQRAHTPTDAAHLTFFPAGGTAANALPLARWREIWAAGARPDPAGAAPFPAALDGRGEDPLAEKLQSLIALLALLVAEPVAGLGPDATRLSNREKGLLDLALRLTYAYAGITADPATHAQQPPLLRDLYQVLRTEDFGPGSNEVARSLADRLMRYVEGSLAGLFAGQTNVALDNPLVVFNIRDLDVDLRPIGLWLITDFVWTRMRREAGQQPRLLLIDEAWSLVQHPEGGQFLASLARRARKYYLGLVTITQDVSDFLTNEYGRTVLNQAAIQLLMRQSSASIDVVGEAFRLSDGERTYLLGCPKGHGLIFARNTHAAIRVEASPMEYWLATTNPRELAAQRVEVGAGAETLQEPAGSSSSAGAHAAAGGTTVGASNTGSDEGNRVLSASPPVPPPEARRYHEPRWSTTHGLSRQRQPPTSLEQDEAAGEPEPDEGIIRRAIDR